MRPAPASVALVTVLAAVLFCAPAANASDSVPVAAVDGAHALYLAQRYAYAGLMKQAAVVAARIGNATPRCVVHVVLEMRAAKLPLCSLDAVHRPLRIARRVERLTAAARSATPAAAARLYERAFRLDPFDRTLVGPLSDALRASGRTDDATRIEAEALQIQGGQIFATEG